MIDTASNSFPPGIKGLSHVLLQVSNLDNAEQFYFHLLGLQVKTRGSFGDRPLISTQQGLGLTTYTPSVTTPPPNEQRNVEHIAFWVNKMDVVLNVLKNAGYQPTEPKRNEYGISASVRDPDGNRIELIEQL